MTNQNAETLFGTWTCKLCPCMQMNASVPTSIPNIQVFYVQTPMQNISSKPIQRRENTEFECTMTHTNFCPIVSACVSKCSNQPRSNAFKSAQLVGSRAPPCPQPPLCARGPTKCFLKSIRAMRHTQLINESAITSFDFMFERVNFFWW